MFANTNLNHAMRAYRRLFLLACALCTSGCATSTAQAAPAATGFRAPRISDNTITNAVDRNLRFDGAVPYDRINVATTEGIVTLTGKVPSLRDKERALAITETVRGVRSVINRIAVNPEQITPDWQVEQDVESALIEDPATESYAIDVSAKAGVATLTGTVDSWGERALAETVAKGVRGVRAVVDEIRVNYSPERPVSEIEPEVQRRLHWDALVDDLGISVAAMGHTIVLSGAVGSAAERSRAITDAYVAGVSEVKADQLHVNAELHDPMRRTRRFIPQSDEQIQSAVADALYHDPRANAFEIKAQAHGGVVSLAGTVHNLKASRAAEQAARNTTGVIQVHNLIKVRPTGPSDEAMENSVAAALIRNPFTEPYEIGVDANDGRITLTGTVKTYFEKAEADTVAATTRGVESVDNELRVLNQRHALIYDPYVSNYFPLSYAWYDYKPYATLKSDSEIRTDIDEALFWSPFVNANEVKVNVNGGVATLNGAVQDYSEMFAAIESAYEGGAVWVDNDLSVMRAKKR